MLFGLWRVHLFLLAILSRDKRGKYDCLEIVQVGVVTMVSIMLGEGICLRRAAIYLRASPKDFNLMEHLPIRKKTLSFFSTRPLGLRKRAVNLKYTCGLRMFLKVQSLRSSRCSVVQFHIFFTWDTCLRFGLWRPPLKCVCVWFRRSGQGRTKSMSFYLVSVRAARKLCVST